MVTKLRNPRSIRAPRASGGSKFLYEEIRPSVLETVMGEHENHEKLLRFEPAGARSHYWDTTTRMKQSKRMSIQNAQTHHYQIGVVSLSLTSDIPEALRDYDLLYDTYRVAHEPHDSYRIEVVCRRPKPWSRSQFVIRTNKEDRVAGTALTTVLPEIEAALAQHLLVDRTEFLAIHAGIMSCRNQGIMLPACSGIGKSTLCAMLLLRGWQYLSDEHCLIHPQTLHVHPYPRALSVKESGMDRLAQLGFHVLRGDGFNYRSRKQLGYVKVSDVRPDAVGSACPIRWQMFLFRAKEPTPKATPLSAAEAFMFTYGYGMNTLPHHHRGVEALLTVVRQAHAFRLDLGDLEESVSMLESLVTETPLTNIPQSHS